VSILRAPGIYGPDRLPLDRLKRGDPVLRPADDVHTNHIDAADLARLAWGALMRARGGRAYNASDDTRLAMGDYFDRVADAFGLPRPPRVTREDARARLSPMMLSFMNESRVLDNRRMKRELRVALRCPDVDAVLARAIALPTSTPQ
jgi:nucleoside-diphosphate-sugar epimerase